MFLITIKSGGLVMFIVTIETDFFYGKIFNEMSTCDDLSFMRRWSLTKIIAHCKRNGWKVDVTLTNL